MYLFIPSDQNTTAFKEVAIIRHPRVGEYAFGFITSSVTLQVIMLSLPEELQNPSYEFVFAQVLSKGFLLSFFHEILI